MVFDFDFFLPFHSTMIELINVFISSINTLSLQKNWSHKYNISTINFFGNVWTSHLGLLLFV
jgi:hypothetical protein